MRKHLGKNVIIKKENMSIKTKQVNLGTVGFAKKKVVRTVIFMNTVKIMSMATIAERKAVQRGTEKNASIGTLMVVTDLNAVPTLTNIHMDQEENTLIKVEVKAIPTEEDPTPGSDTQEADMKVKK